MGNQQLRTYEEIVRRLAVNAKFGDGQLWRHPECVNHKLIFTSTTPELLEIKRCFAPNFFPSGVKYLETKHHKGRYANGKPMYRLASLVHPIVSEIAAMEKAGLIQSLGIEDLALWYLDDGTCILRKDGGGTSYRFILSIGDTCSNGDGMAAFEQRMLHLFGEQWGRVYKNNSKATERNKSWIMPRPVATTILLEARKYGVMPHKFPSWLKLNDYPVRE